MTTPGLDLEVAHRIRILAADLLADHGTEAPPIILASDGTPEGTHLVVQGQAVPFKRVSLYCSNDPEYPHCDVSITIEESDTNGLIIEKTLTLRKNPSNE